MDFFSPEYWQALLSPAAQASLTEKLIIVGVVWITMGRKVSKRFKELKEETQAGMKSAITVLQNHMTTVEETLIAAVKEIKGVKDTVARDLTAHSGRIQTIESGLQTAIKSLEQMNVRLEKVELNKKEQ